jgi:hypothetical protein
LWEGFGFVLELEFGAELERVGEFADFGDVVDGLLWGRLSSSDAHAADFFVREGVGTEACGADLGVGVLLGFEVQAV